MKFPTEKKFAIAMTVYVTICFLEMGELFMPIPIMAAMFFLEGLLSVTSFNIRISATQSYLPDTKRARFNGTFSMRCSMGSIVGTLLSGALAEALPERGIIIGFNVRPDNVAKEEAAATKVEMRMYRVIYDAINDVTDAMKGMLAPKFREVSLGELQVRQVYKISNVGTVAGCRVTSGKITRDSKVRVVRDGIVITEDEIASLKRFKDDAKEVAEGYECGVTLAKFADVKEGDVYEAFKMEEYRD